MARPQRFVPPVLLEYAPPVLWQAATQPEKKNKPSTSGCTVRSVFVRCHLLAVVRRRYDHHGADGATGSSRKKQTTEHPALSTKKSKSDEKI